MIRIRDGAETDINQAAALISQTFRQFNYPDNPQNSSDAYLSFYDPETNLLQVREQFRKASTFLVAHADQRLIGLLRAEHNRIINLFIMGAFHRKGIGTRLMRRYENRCKKNGISKIVLRSQLYAVPFYQACGYKKTTGIRSKFGLIIQPMAKVLLVMQRHC